jgi:type I restriction enzyme S subunit
MRKTYKSYKHSGVEWIGEIPDHWEVKPLKRVSRYNTEVLSEATTADEIISYIEISDVDSQSGIRNSTEYTFKEAPSRARRLIKAGDTLVSTVRTYLKAVGVVQQEQNGFIASTGFCVLRPVDLESRFQGYVCKSRFIEEVARRSVGVSYPAINSTDLVEIPVPQPPYNEQQAISTYLDEKTSLIDSTIRKKEKLIELLLEERTAIINQAVTRGLDPNVKMKDSGVEWLGEIPQHWGTYRLKYVADANPSNIDKKSIEGEQPVLLCNYVDVYKNEFITRGLQFMEATASEDQIKRFTLKEGDVLATKDSEDPSDIAVPAAVKEDLTGVVCGYHLTHIRPIKSILDGFYLHRLFQAYSFNQQFTIKANGVTRYGLPSSAFTEAVVCCPPLNEQKDIVKFLVSKTALIDNSIQNYIHQMSFLKEFRTALINEVVTGKRCVI